MFSSFSECGGMLNTVEAWSQQKWIFPSVTDRWSVLRVVLYQQAVQLVQEEQLVKPSSV